MSFEIDWRKNFYGISWAHEKDRIVVTIVFEDKDGAIEISNNLENWSEKFTRLTIIEKEEDEFALCCYQDPQVSKTDNHIGLFRTGMRQSSGYNQVKPIIEERAPLLQIAFAADAIDITTYEEISKLIPIRKFRIINENNGSHLLDIPSYFVTKPEDYPVSDTFKVLEGHDILRTDNLIIALVVVESDKGKDIRLYRWQKRGEEWKVDLCRMSVLRWNFVDIYNKMMGFRNKYDLHD